MPRLEFSTGEQKSFLESVKSVSKMNNEELAMVCSVSSRTLRDWLNEKHRISSNAFEKIVNKTKISPKKKFKLLPDNWHLTKAAQKGGLAYFARYGTPATHEGRSKGGKRSCLVNQEIAKKGIQTGFVVRKKITLPAHSKELAEAIGIILGDGGMSDFQVSIYSSALVDREYSCHVADLFKKLFCIGVSINDRKKNTIGTVISSREIVEFFNRMGLKTGDKIRNSVSIPNWISANNGYLKACLRGLFDTDGSIFYHKHYINGREYNNIGWEFRNFNQNLLNKFQSFLLKKKFNSKIRGGRVVIHNREDIHRYFKEVGSNNPKHVKRYSKYFDRVK